MATKHNKNNIQVGDYVMNNSILNKGSGWITKLGKDSDLGLGFTDNGKVFVLNHCTIIHKTINTQPFSFILPYDNEFIDNDFVDYRS